MSICVFQSVHATDIAPISVIRVIIIQFYKNRV